MNSISTSTLNPHNQLAFEPSGPLTDLPVFIVLNTILFCGDDLNQLYRGLVLLYQVLCRTDEIQVAHENDIQLLHQFVDNYKAMDSLPTFTAAEPFFFETVKSALELALRMRSYHIIFDSP
ncbi:hypothetical protein [Pseudomonas sp. CLCA07]